MIWEGRERRKKKKKEKYTFVSRSPRPNTPSYLPLSRTNHSHSSCPPSSTPPVRAARPSCLCWYGSLLRPECNHDCIERCGEDCPFLWCLVHFQPVHNPKREKIGTIRCTLGAEADGDEESRPKKKKRRKGMRCRRCRNVQPFVLSFTRRKSMRTSVNDARGPMEAGADGKGKNARTQGHTHDTRKCSSRKETPPAPVPARSPLSGPILVMFMFCFMMSFLLVSLLPLHLILSLLSVYCVRIWSHT